MSVRSTCLLLGSAASLALWGSAGGVLAQVTLDGTANPSFRGPLNGPDYQIRAELGRRAGGNLFHSFERFGLRRGESATFSGPDTIRNVISRVTGGERSNIDGTIASTIPGADLYFLNPAGVMFGPNARLDLQGSFHVSTADELRFDDGAKFSASNPAASSFTVAEPEAFGFLGASPRPITIDRSMLEVRAGATFSLVGGDITVDGGNRGAASGGTQGIVRAAGGWIMLAALNGPGETSLAGGNPAAAAAADIRLMNQALVDASGDGGGTIQIRGGQFLASNESFVLANNTGASDASTGIAFEAEAVRIESGSLVTAEALGQGDAGRVAVAADRLMMSSGLIISRTRASGDAGSVVVTAGDLTLGGRDGSGIISDSVEASGAAGSVVVTADNLTVRFGEIDSANVGGGGVGRDAGSVVVTAGNLTLHSVGRIRVDNLDSTGDGGSVVVTADNLTVRGGSISSDSFGGSGDGGSVVITADQLMIRDGGSISSQADASGAQNTFSNAGSVTITATVLDLREGGSISSAAFSDGNAGRVAVSAGRLLMDRGEITTTSASAGGGEIQVTVEDFIDLRNSAITTSVAGGADPTAGNILIDPKVLVIDGSTIKADADTGSGGSVQIIADNILVPEGDLTGLIARGDVSATGETEAVGGTVAISAPEVDISGGLVVLDAALLDAASQLRQRCAARRDIGASSFTGVGRGGLPPSPDGPLLGAYTLGAERAAVIEIDERDEPDAAPGAVTLVLPCRGPA